MTNPSDKVTNFVGPSQPDELAALMAKYGSALRRYFVRKGAPSIADDLVQDVFLRLQVSAEHGSLADAERYIFTVAKRALLDRQKFDARRDADLHDPFDEATAGLIDDISPERILSGKQEYSRAMVAISALPSRMRLALVLHRFGKLSFSAIAQHMGVQKGTVQVLIQRAMERVAKDMGGRDGQ